MLINDSRCEHCPLAYQCSEVIMGNSPPCAVLVEEKIPAPNNARDEICAWAVENKSDGYYHTTCGEVVQSLLNIEGMQFCPYCGHKLSPVA